MSRRRSRQLERPGRRPWTARACLVALTATVSIFGAEKPARSDPAPTAQTHQVIVGDDFFSPADLTIAVGDTVRWSKSTTGEHNVQSCAGELLGCSGETANESFSNGPPRSTPWFYSHTFVLPGTNPYFCLAHISFMIGSVEVVGAPAAPPPVPDGEVVGAPMTVRKLDADGSDLEVAWDASTCSGATEFSLLYGVGSGLPATPGGVYGLAGSICDLAGPSHPWMATPDPTADPTGLVWWILVATDGAEREGSWGPGGTTDERNGPGANGSSVECGVVTKDLSNTCHP